LGDDVSVVPFIAGDIELDEDVHMAHDTKSFIKDGLSDEVEHKRFPLGSGVVDTKQVNVEESTFEGFSAGIGNRDQGDDIIMPGAFQKSINERVHEGGKVKLLDGHSSFSTRSVWGKAIDAAERALEENERKQVADMLDIPVDAAPTHRLWTKFLVSQKQDAQEALQDVAEGILDGLSIGFRTVRTEFVPDEDALEDNPDADAELLWLRGQGVRKIHELAWWETSLVVWGMNRAALTIPSSVKSVLSRVSKMQEGEPVDEKQVRYAIRSLKKLVGDVEEDPRLAELEELETARKEVAEAIEVVEKQNEVPSDAREMIINLYDDFTDSATSSTTDNSASIFKFTTWVGEQVEDIQINEEEQQEQDNKCAECDTVVSDQAGDQLNKDGICLDCEKTEEVEDTNVNEDTQNAQGAADGDSMDPIDELQEKVSKLEDAVEQLAESISDNDSDLESDDVDDDLEANEDVETSEAEEKDSDEDADTPEAKEDSDTEEEEEVEKKDETTPEVDEEVAGDTGEHKSEEDEDADGHSDERFEKDQDEEGKVLDNALNKLKLIELEEQTGG
jgi:phage head maturation protease